MEEDGVEEYTFFVTHNYFIPAVPTHRVYSNNNEPQQQYTQQQ
jgi:hypothetical protein